MRQTQALVLDPKWRWLRTLQQYGEECSEKPTSHLQPTHRRKVQLDIPIERASLQHCFHRSLRRHTSKHDSERRPDLERWPCQPQHHNNMAYNCISLEFKYSGLARMQTHPCGPGNPLCGHPSGLPSISSKVYSCSIPNQGSSAATFVATSAAALRWFVSNGVLSYL